MKHLSIDEILDFVSMTELNSESIKLSATVNGHIRECESCLELVRAFQMIYDDFYKLDSTDSFRSFISQNISILENKNEYLYGISKTIAELGCEMDGFR